MREEIAQKHMRQTMPRKPNLVHEDFDTTHKTRDTKRGRAKMNITIDSVVKWNLEDTYTSVKL